MEEHVDRERREVLFSGHVQGVGFRYTVCQIASGFDVGGFVRNLPGGNVQLVVEGPSQAIDRLVGDVQTHMGRHIRETQQSRSDATGEFHGFRIRY